MEGFWGFGVNVKNLHQIIFYELILGFNIRHFPNIFDRSSKKFLTAFDWLDLIAFDGTPDALKHILLISLKMFSKFEIVQIYETDNFPSSFVQLIRNFLKFLKFYT